jgi:hypothetical protein
MSYRWFTCKREDTPKELGLKRGGGGRQFYSPVTDGRDAVAVLTQSGCDKHLWSLNIVGAGQTFQTTTCNDKVGESGTRLGAYLPIPASKKIVENQAVADEFLSSIGWLPLNDAE